jgi:hypothetical protein
MGIVTITGSNLLSGGTSLDNVFLAEVQIHRILSASDSEVVVEITSDAVRSGDVFLRADNNKFVRGSAFAFVPEDTEADEETMDLQESDTFDTFSSLGYGVETLPEGGLKGDITLSEDGARAFYTGVVTVDYGGTLTEQKVKKVDVTDLLMTKHWTRLGRKFDADTKGQARPLRRMFLSRGYAKGTKRRGQDRVKMLEAANADLEAANADLTKALGLAQAQIRLLQGLPSMPVDEEEEEQEEEEEGVVTISSSLKRHNDGKPDGDGNNKYRKYYDRT